MKEYLKYGLVLLVVAAISTGVLAFVNSITAPLIEENKQIARANAQRAVFPEANSFQSVESEIIEYYEALDVENRLLGYVVEAIGIGYNGAIKSMVGLDLDFRIKGVTVLEQSETPGLGDKITKIDFLNHFNNLHAHFIRLDREGGNITNITGASISTRALTNSIREKIEQIEANIIVEPISDRQDDVVPISDWQDDVVPISDWQDDGNTEEENNEITE